ncbi:hypothetical protein GIV00_00090 [Enterococcus faecium]|nr:hypothetical protein [Enterococcus faecium]
MAKNSLLSVNGKENNMPIKFIELKKLKQKNYKKNYFRLSHAEKDQDRLRLMTCTPKGVNSHRFLVYVNEFSFSKEDLKLQKKSKK